MFTEPLPAPRPGRPKPDGRAREGFSAGERRERPGGVLGVLYVTFAEGATATSGDRLPRPVRGTCPYR
ncbi:hypothetical protein [Streptosporangium sp. NPDC023615]|uniref:hypothetical protein n=1 Tax=Streptosporangium sp. NPDC023615 TaxID=3154794 RepID=UPI003435D8CF